jgi:integrase/recombinase XerC
MDLLPLEEGRERQEILVIRDVQASSADTGTREHEAAQMALKALVQDRRSAATQRAYAGDLKDFFGWRQQEVCAASVCDLCALDAGRLTQTLLAYKAELVRRGLSEATCNRRLSAVRSLLRMARRLGAGNPDPAGLVASEKVKEYRDTRGVSTKDVARLLEAPDRTTLKGKRDYALLVLLWENTLRRAEVCGCDVAHFDAGAQRLSIKRLSIKGKGSGTQREPITLSARAVGAIVEYLQARCANDEDEAIPEPASPLFCSAAHYIKKESRLQPDGLHHLIAHYGKKVLGRPLRPHAMRHTSITALLDATRGDVRMAQRLSRHADLRTLQKYDDNREDLQGKATTLLSALV